MAEIERIDIVKLTITNGEFKVIKAALEDRARGYCDTSESAETAALNLLAELNGK
jgi:hypothetical protein